MVVVSFCLQNSMLATNEWVVDMDIAQILQPADQIEGFVTDEKLTQEVAILDYLEAE